MIVAQTRDGKAVTAKDLKADGAMAVLLKDALAPNLVQTLEGSPAFVHGGPFANIAHGCNSVMATRLGAEAGRRGGDRGRLRRRSWRGEVHRHQVPVGRADAVLRGGRGDGAGAEDAWRRGAQRAGHGRTSRRSSAGWPTWRGMSRTWGNSVCRWWSAVNHFTSDTEAEFAAIRDAMARRGWRRSPARTGRDGSAGAEALARAVSRQIDAGQGGVPAAVSDGPEARRQDPHHRAEDLPRRRTSRCPTRWRGGWRASRRPASATCRCASPRRSTASPPIRR